MIRLAPAKVNLTLAVLGHAPRRLPRPPQRDGPARPRGPALASRCCRPACADSLHVDGLRPGPGRRQPRPARDRRRPPARRRGLGPPRAAAAARRPPRQADPGRRRARRRIVRRRRGRRRGARGVGRRRSTTATRHRIAAELGSDVPFFLAGGPALVEGRGERVTPLGWLRDARRRPGDRPGLLLVTPASGSRRRPRSRRSTPARAPVGGAARLASTHLADELRNGPAGRRPAGAGRACSPPPTTSRPRRRSSSPASCRSSARCCGCSRGRSACPAPARPTGRSILRVDEAAAAAERVRAGVRRRRSCPTPGGTGAVRRRDPDPRRHRRPREAAMTRQAISTDQRPGALGPYSQAIATDGLVFCSGQLGIDPATGRARSTASRPRPSGRCATSRPCSTRPGASLGGRRQDHDLPRRHRRLRRRQRGLRDATCPTRRPPARPSPSRPCRRRAPGRDRDDRPALDGPLTRASRLAGTGLPAGTVPLPRRTAMSVRCGRVASEGT